MNQTHVLIVGDCRDADRLVPLGEADSESISRLPVAQVDLTLAEFCAEFDVDSHVSTAMTSVSRSITHDIVLLKDGLFQMCHQRGLDLVIFMRHPSIPGSDQQLECQELVSPAARREFGVAFGV